MTPPVRPEPADDLDAQIAARRRALGVPMPSATGAETFDNALTPKPVTPSSRLGALNDFVLGLHQGASGGFGDEIAGLGAALALGRPSAAKALARDAEAQVHAGEARSPMLSLAGNLAGAVGAGILTGNVANVARGADAVPVVASPGGLARVGRVLRSVGTAGAAGGAVGAGTASGDFADRVRGAEAGALAGAGLGAGLGLAGAVIRPFANLARAAIPRPLTEASPVARAAAASEGTFGRSVVPTSAQRVAGTQLLQDVERSGLTLDEYLARARANPRAALYDLGPSLPQSIGSPLIRTDPAGDPLVRRARAVQSIPSTGSAQVSQAITRRAEARPAAVTSALESGLGAGRENTAQVAEQLVTQRAAQSAPLYQQAFEHGAIDDPRINTLIQKPIAAEAWRQANRLAAAEGHELPQVFHIERTPTSIVGRDGKPLVKERLVATDVPDVRTLHYLKLGLDDVIESNTGRPLEQGGISSSMAHAAQQQKGELLAVLDQVPAYKEARSVYAGNSEAMRAYERGAKILTEKADDLEHQWASWSDADKELYRRRAVAAIEDEVARTGRPDKLLNTLTARKLRLIFPDDASYDAFELGLRRQVQGAANDRVIMQGSPTARILAEQADLAGPEEAMQAMRAVTSPSNVVSRLLSSGVARAVRGETERRADALAPYLNASGTEAVERLQYLQALQRELDNARRLRAASRAGAVGTLGGRPR